MSESTDRRDYSLQGLFGEPVVQRLEDGYG